MMIATTQKPVWIGEKTYTNEFWSALDCKIDLRGYELYVVTCDGRLWFYSDVIDKNDLELINTSTNIVILDDDLLYNKKSNTVIGRIKVQREDCAVIFRQNTEAFIQKCKEDFGVICNFCNNFFEQKEKEGE